MQLEVSTSPRSTWLWAADVPEAQRLRAILEAAGHSAHPAIGQNAEPRILDLDIGVVAYEALTALMDAGYSFVWHPSQHVLNRTATIVGLPVDDLPHVDPS